MRTKFSENCNHHDGNTVGLGGSLFSHLCPLHLSFFYIKKWTSTFCVKANTSLLKERFFAEKFQTGDEII